MTLALLIGIGAAAVSTPGITYPYTPGGGVDGSFEGEGDQPYIEPDVLPVGLMFNEWNIGYLYPALVAEENFEETTPGSIVSHTVFAGGGFVAGGFAIGYLYPFPNAELNFDGEGNASDIVAGTLSGNGFASFAIGALYPGAPTAELNFDGEGNQSGIAAGDLSATGFTAFAIGTAT
jgi:hypothetical protein